MLGGEFAEPVDGEGSSGVLSCKLERLSLVGFDLSQLVLPSQFPYLTRLELRSVAWGRMVFEIMRRSPALVSATIVQLEYQEEAGQDLLPDWPLWVGGRGHCAGLFIKFLP